MDKSFCTVAETAMQLGVSEKTVRHWMLKRQIPFVKIMGGRVQIRQSDINRIIEHGSYKVGQPDGQQKIGPWAATGSPRKRAIA